jgi:lipoprotein signal peptidase
LIPGLIQPAPPARLAFLFTIMAFLVDWASKGWAEHRLAAGPIDVGQVTLAVIENDALVFSLGEGVVPMGALILSRLALFGLCAFLATGRTHLRVRTRLGFAFLAAGALGNLVDLPFRDGAVVDFIGIDPVALVTGRSGFHMFFNIADVYILVGLVLVLPALRTAGFAVQARFRVWERRVLQL